MTQGTKTPRLIPVPGVGLVNPATGEIYGAAPGGGVMPTGKKVPPPPAPPPPAPPTTQQKTEQPITGDVLSVERTTGPDRFIVRTQREGQKPGQYLQSIMSAQEVRQRGGEIPVKGAPTWGHGAGTKWASPDVPTEESEARGRVAESKEMAFRKELKVADPVLHEVYVKEGPEAFNRELKKTYVELPDGYIKRTEWDKWLDSLPDDRAAHYVRMAKKEGMAKADKVLQASIQAKEKDFKATHVEFPDGWYAKEDVQDWYASLPKDRAAYYIKLAKKGGIDKASAQLKSQYETEAKYFRSKNIIIGDRSMPLKEWNPLPDEYKTIALHKGFDAMINTIKSDNARMEATLKALDKYTDKDGGVNLYLAVADYKEGRSKASPDDIKEVMGVEDKPLVNKALKAYDASRKTKVALPGEVTYIDVLTLKTYSKEEYDKLSARNDKKLDQLVLSPMSGRRKLIDVAEYGFVPIRSLKPEVEIKDISKTEWAVGGAQLAILASPFVGGVAGRAMSVGAGSVFGYATFKHHKDLTLPQKVLGYGVTVLALIPVVGLGKGIISRARPGVLTGESLALTTDIGRVVIPKNMPKLAARQLVQDIERLQLNGSISARELQPLAKYTNVAKVKITRGPNGTVDIVLKSADGKAIGRISAMQRINSDIVYHATDDIDSVIKQINEKGYFEVKGPEPRRGLFLSQQPAQQFMFNVQKGVPVKAPGMAAFRLAKGELRPPPASVLDSPNLTVMRNKMYALNQAGKLDPGVYVLTKGYGKPMHLEYELYAAEGTKFYPLKSTWYAPGKVPATKVTSVVGYQGTGKTVSPGGHIPMYWLGSEKALAAGTGVPTLKQMYTAKLLGDLTAMRQYAPWNLRLGRRPAMAEGETVYAGGPWRSAIKQITLKAVPEDTAAGRVSALVHNSEGKILLTRTQGQKRFDLPGGGVLKKGKIKALVTGKGEPIDVAMRRELWEEVGIKPSYLNHIDTFQGRFSAGGKSRKFQIFETTTTAKPKPSVEIAEYAWWDGKSKLKYPVAEFAKQAIIRQRRLAVMEDAQIIDAAIVKAGKSVKKLDAISRQSDRLLSESLQQAYRRGYLPYKPGTIAPRPFSFLEYGGRAVPRGFRLEAADIRTREALSRLSPREVMELESLPYVERLAALERLKERYLPTRLEGKAVTKIEGRPAVVTEKRVATTTRIDKAYPEPGKVPGRVPVTPARVPPGTTRPTPEEDRKSVV